LYFVKEWWPNTQICFSESMPNTRAPCCSSAAKSRRIFGRSTKKRFEPSSRTRSSSGCRTPDSGFTSRNTRSWWTKLLHTWSRMERKKYEYLVIIKFIFYNCCHYLLELPNGNWIQNVETLFTSSYLLYDGLIKCN